MSGTFQELVELASTNAAASVSLSREDCLAATREFALQCRDEIHRRHKEGNSGSDVVNAFSDAADRILRGVFRFALASLPTRHSIASRVALCALGGYGRGHLSPHSDLDICLLYEGPLVDGIRSVNSYLVPFLWDAGFKVGFSIRSMDDVIVIAKQDLTAFTSLLEGRFITGDSTAFARMKLFLRELRTREFAQAYIARKMRERTSGLAENYRDLFNTEPNVKENAGGLRDYHTALWLLMVAYDINSLDEAVSQGLITADENLDFIEGLDFVWRIRNELHFHAGVAQDELTFANQRHVAKVFGHATDGTPSLSRFMGDYYAAATKLRRLLQIVARICNYSAQAGVIEPAHPAKPEAVVENGFLYMGMGDSNWFAHSPARLMEVFWRCARHTAVLSRPTERLVVENLHFVNDTFRSSDLVRRFFVAICNHPLQAGHALRQAARCGFLGAYLHEFAEVNDVIRYRDFHSYPVGEHTLRAIEALARIEEIEGPVGDCLRETLDNLTDPYVLVMAILFHDLGKVSGDVHVDESVRIAREICRRIGMHEDDEERIAFLVQHHVLMTNISQYRDIEDEEIVVNFTATMKTEQRLRALFLLSYADLCAVGPGVWNDWKGTLLMRLYLKAVKQMMGRAETVGEEYWESPKAEQVADALPDEMKAWVKEHLRGLGIRYFVAFGPEQIASHIRNLAKAKDSGLVLDSMTNDIAGTTEVVIFTKDRPGLFSQIAGSFTSQLVDVNTASLFTRDDGYVVDSFVVTDAHRRAPLTSRQVASIEDVLRRVLLHGDSIQDYVDKSRKRLFALLQPRVPVKTRIDFDNMSSRNNTVIDIETGDRTGLLYDITRAMADAGLDISTARIVTDARRVRDSFYVTKDNAQIEETSLQQEIRECIHEAMHPRTAADSKGGA